jgi:hypothetical protein
VVRLLGEVAGGLVILVLIVISGILYHHHWQIHWVFEPGQCATEGGTSKQILDHMKLFIYWNTPESGVGFHVSLHFCHHAKHTIEPLPHGKFIVHQKTNVVCMYPMRCYLVLMLRQRGQSKSAEKCMRHKFGMSQQPRH